MELNDFKFKENLTGVAGQDGNPDNQSGMNGLVNELKAADNKARKAMYQYIIIIFVLLGIYASRMAIYKGPLSIGYELLVIGFVLILLYIFSKIMMIRKIDYACPAMTFLKKAERRYTFIPLTEWFIIIPILAILGTGGGFVVHYSFLKYFEDVTVPVVIYIVFFISITIFGTWASKKNWLKEHGQTLEKIRNMRREMEFL
jgi:hypothetical protein